MFFACLAGFWACLLVAGIVRYSRASDRIYDELFKEMERLEDKSEDDVVEDVSYREVVEDVDELHEVRKTLKNLGEKSEKIEGFTKRCVEDLDETKELKKTLDELRGISFNPTTFENLQGTFFILRKDIIQNARDIITILIASRSGKHFSLGDEDKKEIERELSDNRRRIEKFREILREGARFATQKDNASSDLDLDSWNDVLKQLNSPPPTFSAD